MSPTWPAVRAHKAMDFSSPGAGNTYLDLYHDGIDGQGGLTPLTTGTPVQKTTFATNGPALSLGNTPTLTAVVLVSTSTVTIVAPEGLSFSNPASDSIHPAVTSSSDIIASPSPTSITTTTLPAPSTTTQEASSPNFQGPVFGSITTSSMVSMTSSPHSDLAGSVSGRKRTLSGGGIAAVVIVLLLALCAVVLFVLRNRRVQKRIARRATWTAGLAPGPNLDSSLEKGPNVHTISSAAPTVAAGQSTMSGGNGGVEAPVQNIARKPPLPYSPVSPTAPPQAYNNPPHTIVPGVHAATVPTVASASAQDRPMVVRVTFVPQLPDELAITPGETLFIQTEFDDGWALCVNTRGGHGMVPLECLDGQSAGVSRVGDWRTSRRASSLRPAHGSKGGSCRF